MSKRYKRNKGITLLALIITIIVLLILTTVTIKIVSSSGIIGKAQDATKKYSEAEKAEQEKILKAEYEMARYEGKFDGSYNDYIVYKTYGVRIGDYVAYDHTKDENGEDVAIQIYESKQETNGYGNQEFYIEDCYEWIVLGIEDGKLLLVSEAETPFDIQGSAGYMYGTKEMNEISKLYGQGKYAESARSLEIDDVNKMLGYNPRKTGDGNPSWVGKIYEYGNKVTYGMNAGGKVTYVDRDNVEKISDKTVFWNYDKESNQFKELKSGEKVEIENSYYGYYTSTLRNYPNGDKITKTPEYKEFHNTIGGFSDFWLATRCIETLEGLCSYAVFCYMMGYAIEPVEMARSNDLEYEYIFPGTTYVCPVITLKDNVQIGEKVDGVWQLEYK